MRSLDLNQDTIRQRRNLIVTTLLLIFINVADVTFGNTVKFLGASLSIGNPDVIEPTIWVFELYFLWRFYQYFASDQAHGALTRQFKDYMDSHTQLHIVRLICKPRGLKGLSGKYSYECLERLGLFSYRVKAVPSGGDVPATGALKDDFTADISAIKLECYRLFDTIGFLFRARILTDYFVPYFLVIFAVYLQLV